MTLEITCCWCWLLVVVLHRQERVKLGRHSHPRHLLVSNCGVLTRETVFSMMPAQTCHKVEEHLTLAVADVRLLLPTATTCGAGDICCCYLQRGNNMTKLAFTQN